MGKKFIKSVFVVLSLVVLFSLFACEKRETFEPEIKGVQSQMTAYTGDVFDFMAGITATDKYGKDVTDKVKYYTAAPMNEKGELIQSGEYSVRYELEINGVVLTQEYAMLKVIFKKPDVITDNMIFNGDFSSGYTDPFVLSQFENGTGTFGVENEELYVNITNIAAAQASPRVDYNDLQLDPDKFYEVRFDARANVPRWLHIQIGQLIDSAPWFYSVDPIERYFHLDTTMQTFSFRFQPSTKEGADMTKISLLFEFGKMKDEAILTTCFLDNIVMQEVDSLGEDTTPPTITAPSGEFIAYVGEKLNVPVTAYDDFDKDITDRLEVSGDEIPVDENGLLTTEGVYTLIYKVKDTAGNEATATVTVKVNPPRQFADPDNLFGTPDTEVVWSESGAGSEDNSKLNPLKWHIWNISDPSWGIGPTTTVNYSYQDGVLMLDFKQNGNPNFWANQVFYTTLPFEEGGSFIFTVKVVSNKAGKITLAEAEVELVEGENLVEVPITVASGSAFTFSLQAGIVDNPVGDIVLQMSDFAINPQENVEYADPDNLFGTPDTEVVWSESGAGSEDNSKLNPLKWHIWNNSDPSWNLGPITELTYTYVDGVLTINAKQNGNPNFWANQVFYTTLPFKQGGDFVLKIKVTSDKAGKISIAGADVELVVGENYFEIPIKVANKMAFTLGMTFGTNADGPIGDIELAISDVKIERVGEVPEPEYADPENILGTVTDESLYQESGIAEEKVAQENPYKLVIWYDMGGWAGAPSYIVYTMEEGVLKLSITQPAGSAWFAAQLFYFSLPVKDGGTYALTFKLNSNKAGKITVNGNVIDIVEGMNEIKVKVTVAPEAQFPVKIQFGTEIPAVNMGDLEAEISELKATPWVDEGDEEPEKLPTPVGLVASNMNDTTLYTAWAAVENAVSYKLYIYTEAGEEVKTLTVTNGQNTPFEELGLEGGNYYAKLQAIGDGVNYLDSDLSAPSAHFTVPTVNEGEPKKLATPFGFVAEIYEVDKFRTAWGGPTDAPSYKAYIYSEDGTEVKVLTVTNGGLIPLSELGLPAGSYYAKLQAVGDGVNTLDSDLSPQSGTFVIA
ncbi:MAG: Carbohydrate binding domain protein [Tenericutes bacterium ADurb.Bin140]|nr:MAG: Carbohydrate binding domain protein [Tenericutes bacterium ADurb.Bin140]